MPRKLICAALALFAATAVNSVSAQTSSFEGPPPWRDNASVYLNPDRVTEVTTTAPGVESETAAQSATNVVEKVATPQPVVGPPQLAPTPPPAFDSTIRHAIHEADSNPAPNDSQRRLPPPTAAAITAPSPPAGSVATRQLPNLSLRWDSISTMVSALGVVIGCFLICTWLVRRGTRKTSAALPRDVVSVLGRVPLAARNVAQLIRVGNKLVLVSLTPAGAEALTEVTDPAEVDRLVGLCHQSDSHSTTKAFEHVFRQMSLEPTPTGFLGPESYQGYTARG
jgi:flagellar biogenesis protein FliO